MNDLEKKLKTLMALSEENRLEICQKIAALEINSGASINVDEVGDDYLKLSVVTINGKRTRKTELFNYTYKLFSTTLPEKYRTIIKV